MAINQERKESVKRMILEGGTVRDVSKRAQISRGVVQRLRSELTKSGQLERNNPKTPREMDISVKIHGIISDFEYERI